MRFRIDRRESAYPVPRAAVVAAVVLAVLGTAAAVAPGLSDGPVLCPFRRATGLPCPSCGLLRSARSLIEGDVARAFAVNPMDAVLLMVAPLVAALMLVTNRRGGPALRVDASPPERRACWTILVVVVAANWAYVLATHG